LLAINVAATKWTKPYAFIDGKKVSTALKRYRGPIVAAGWTPKTEKVCVKNYRTKKDEARKRCLIWFKSEYTGAG